MLDKVQKYISENSLFTKKDKLLVGLSGGSDSVTLCYTLKQLGYNFSVAHCNFKLRAKDSDDDEKFVINLSQKLNIKCYITHFNTTEYASVNKYSIEQAARKLRYNWFEEIRSKHSYNYILTAHHSDDKIESFFLNLTAGTGIKGMRSIKPKNGNVIRPFLCINSSEIKEWCKQNHIKYRTDKTNKDINFKRNFIRHKIISLFEKLNPSFSNTMQNNFLIYNDLEQIYQQFIETAIPKIVNSSEKQIRISIDNLLNMPASRSILFEILSTYGFNPSQVNQIHSEIRHLQTGKTFFSEDYCIVKNRNDLILEQIRQEQSTPVVLSEHLRSISYPISLYIEYQEYTANFIFENNKNIAYFDADKISFPLLIRNKQQGDYFYPFGMKGKKLISDYYTDIKLSLFEKEKTFLLVSAEEIIWVIGYRTDNRFKVSKNTQTILKISCNSV